jgi:tetratricopeptide (TPR) repeat protein
MWLHRLNTRIVTEVGNTLADHFVTAAMAADAGGAQERGKRKAIQAFLTRVDREALPLKLGMFRRAKLASAFKLRLLSRGIEAELANELARMLVLRLMVPEVDATPPAAATEAAPSHSPKATEQQTRLEGGSVRSLLARADSAAARGDHEEVVESYRQLLRLKPRHLLARNNLGVAYWKLGRYHEAAEEFRRAAGIQSTYPDAQFNHGTILRLTGHVVESELPLRRAVKLSPNHVEARASLGLTLVLLGRLRDAQDSFEKCLKLAPNHPGASVGLGRIASLEGRFDDAEMQYRRALAVDANMPTAWAGLVELRRMTAADGDWLQGAEKIAASGIAPTEEADLRFAIGKYCDDTGEFERAFKSFKRGNELLKMSASRYEPGSRVRYVEDLIRTYTREALSAPAPGSSDSTRPVLVVGMMRSGTTLVEQIIASHPEAHGAGELPFWTQAAAKHEEVVRRGLPDEALRKKLAGEYLQTLEHCSADARRVVDKSNFNSDHLGLIHSVLPRSRIVYVRRDPLDTCLSCYFNQLSSAQSFTLDLSDLAHYYREHQRLMTHWRSVLPAGSMMEVPYAELVDNQEKWTRKILDFIGLEWDERCLEYHTASRPVLTASFWQVRQRLYTDSVGRWRRYEKFLGPLRELRDLA